MSNLRELTDSELDIVSGGAQAVYKIAEPVRNPIVTLIEDIIRVVESLEGCNFGGKVAVYKIPHKIPLRHAQTAGPVANSALPALHFHNRTRLLPRVVQIKPPPASRYLRHTGATSAIPPRSHLEAFNCRCLQCQDFRRELIEPKSARGFS